MAWPDLRRIVCDLAEINYQGRVHPYGNGEPLTDPEFIERVHYIRMILPDCYLFIATNGDFINNPHSFKDLLDAGLNEIQCNHYDDKNEHLKKDSPPEVVHYDIGMLRTTFYNRAGNIDICNITPSASCWFPKRKLYFNYRGDMLICCSDWQSKYPIGNIRDDSINNLLMSTNWQKNMETLCSRCNLIRHQEVV